MTLYRDVVLLAWQDHEGEWTGTNINTGVTCNLVPFYRLYSNRLCFHCCNNGKCIPQGLCETPRDPQRNTYLLAKLKENIELVQIDAEILHRVLSFVEEAQAGDCRAFAKYVCRLDDEWKGAVQIDYESSLRPGDPVCIAQVGGKVVHYAVYIGHGYYISKLGIRGSVNITTLKQMTLFYEADGNLYLVGE